MIPIVAGLLMGAAMGGGIAALQKKNILEGALMGAAGGALGGVLMPAAGATGAMVPAAEGAAIAGTTGTAGGAVGASLPPAYLPPSTTAELGTMFSGGSLPGGTANLGFKIPTSMGGLPAPTAASTGIPAGTGLTVPTSMTNAAVGAGGSGGIGNFLSANKGALMGGGLGGMMASANEPEKRSEGNIYDMTYSQERNPLFGQPGEPAFINQGYKTNSVTPVEDYKPTMTAANGGIIALAEGGQTDRYKQPTSTVNPAVAAYNAKLMERANQQYNVNLPPAPNQVPGSVGYIAPRVAPVTNTSSSDSISGLTFNPVTQRYEGEFVAPGDKKKTQLDDDYNDLYGRDKGYSHASGDGGGGNANGGLMSSYAAGGISTLGSYSDGGQLLRGPGDGVSDSIPARIGARQPARLADGEFVVPARIVSEIGNGSTDAGAKQLYAMMDRVQKNRKKTVGKGKVAVDAKSRKLLPA
jgi:hypothetical protein